MRRPWIKIETCTPDKPEICSLATHLKMDEDTVVGKLVRLWSWAELNRINPNDIGVTKEFIDKLVGRKGFAAGLAQTGWLVETEGKLSFRNFKRHNSPVAQNKALTAKRVARHRLRKATAKKKVTAKPLDSAVTQEVQAETTASIDSSAENQVTDLEVTIESLSNPTLPSADEAIIEDFTNGETDVITHDSALVINVKNEFLEGRGDVKSVTLPDDPPIFIEEPGPPAQTDSVEEASPAQPEEPSPRKRRSKAAQDTPDQPMLF